MHATNEDLPDNGWQQYTSEPVTVYLVEGDHESIHAGKGLAQIIDGLNKGLG